MEETGNQIKRRKKGGNKRDNRARFNQIIGTEAAEKQPRREGPLEGVGSGRRETAIRGQGFGRSFAQLSVCAFQPDRGVLTSPHPPPLTKKS